MSMRPPQENDRRREMLDNVPAMDATGRPEFGLDAQIEYILKIPRSIDHRTAEELNERHRRFVEEEIKRFTLALASAEDLSSECKPASHRTREDGQDSV